VEASGIRKKKSGSKKGSNRKRGSGENNLARKNRLLRLRRRRHKGQNAEKRNGDVIRQEIIAELKIGKGEETEEENRAKERKRLEEKSTTTAKEEEKVKRSKEKGAREKSSKGWALEKDELIKKGLQETREVWYKEGGKERVLLLFWRRKRGKKNMKNKANTKEENEHRVGHCDCSSKIRHRAQSSVALVV